jgi:hypothetical protein
MSSITSMQYAIRKSESRWEKETAERILRIREKMEIIVKNIGILKSPFIAMVVI